MDGKPENPAMANPVETLAAVLNIAPSDLDRALHDNGLMLTSPEQDARTREWEQKLRSGELYERKVNP